MLLWFKHLLSLSVPQLPSLPDSSTLPSLKCGYYLFMVIPHPLTLRHSPPSLTPSLITPHTTDSCPQLVRVYLKPSFSVSGLKGYLSSPGTGLLLRDVFYQKSAGK